MSKLKLCTVSRDQLNGIPVVSGNLIFIKDDAGLYYDMNGVRYGLQSSNSELYSPSASGELSGTIPDVDLTDTKYSSLVFVFQDAVSKAQFSCEIYGESNSESYSYDSPAAISASLHLNESASGSIAKRDVYVSGSIESTGSFSIDSADSILETVTNGSMTATASDYTGNIALVKIIGRC